MYMVFVIINMHKYLFLPVLFCLSVNLVTAQKLDVSVTYVTANGPSDNAIIYYKKDTKLSWDDFKGEPVESGAIAAITSSGFGFNLGFRNVGGVASMTINVYCDFSKNKSWVKPARKSDYILSHEQHHFDISYISARQFIKKLKTAEFTTTNYRPVIERVYTDCAKEMEVLQNQYDSETLNGQLQDKQQEWERKIDQKLLSLNTAENIL